MSQNFSESVILITSSNASTNGNFGTGFVIDKDEQKTYLLTCAHVVKDVGESKQIKANGLPATVIVSGEDKGFDLAVLRVEGLLDKPRLNLCAIGEEENPFIISGFYEFARTTPPALRDIRGQLGKQIRLASSDGCDRINAWDLRMEDKHYLQPGYSGSPVIERSTGCVLGVVSYRIGKGEEGLAISIEALKQIWKEIPKNLIMNVEIPKTITPLSSAIQRKIERIKRDISLAENQSNELTELIQAIVDEINENQGNFERQRNLNKKKKRYEEEREQYDKELERLQVEIENLLLDKHN
ncbi:MAG: hypothetical protein HC941_05560 [Microcoleus sp. SU_5_3]|nr:hypothetical protein [Microcoleus sp. SU_5_3]